MTKQKSIHREKPIPKKKLKAVEELSELAGTKKTIMIASIKNLPASQFQEITKKLRGKAIVKVPKKNIILRAIDAVNDEDIVKLKEHLKEDTAILFSDLDAFELASDLIDARSPAKAKKGQEAPSDIEVQAGPTDLIPGPAVSELGALGIAIMIDKGKINIKETKIIVRKGEKISAQAADVMTKLDIKPFLVGFEPLAAFDTKDKKLYLEIKVDREGTLNELKISFGKALSFAVEIGYYCEDTIKLIIQKVGREELALEKIAEAGTSERSEGDNKKKQIDKINSGDKSNSQKIDNPKDNSEPQSGEANHTPEEKSGEEK